MLISMAKLAKLAGVSRAAVSLACKKGGALFTALCDSKIDTEAEASRRYIRKKGLDPSIVFDVNYVQPLKSKNSSAKKVGSGKAAGTSSSAPASPFYPPADPLPTGDSDPQDFESKTLAELCEIFGTDERFKTWTDARKKLTEIRKNDIANAKSVGELVSRKMVKIIIIDPIESAHKKLLTDVAKTISIRAAAMCTAGEKQEDIEAFVADQITSIIRPVKAKIKRAFRNV